ncbi:hypothetical protein T440DRAFT_457067 [Plenodomus tracheiphilus IPT5]|uniref:Uncharacterized protein n=1 Tax=Plenodomus tracheiphilus IPT5 TaxID=1408161 RepID=A0A6A7AVY2_9PLEO|nr:hypothetical protein T440DRAFT_457067 [Plenodomus tracheiphilus IPT5]
MAPPSKPLCIFFARGACRSGEACRFGHERDTGTHSRSRPVVPIYPPLGTPDINSSVTSIHEAQGPKANNLPQRLPDSRNEVPCKFFLQPGGCQKDSCPFLHVTQGPQSVSTNGQGLESNEDEEPDDLSRAFSGASVQFDEFGHVLKISLPTDYSVACITGFPPGTTSEAVVDALHELGFDLNISQVRIPSQGLESEIRATVKMENPLFAEELSSTLRKNHHQLSAAPLAIATKRTDGRKVYISWHKAARNAWVNFGSGEIAKRVAQKFNEGRYTCLDRHVKSSTAKHSSSYGRSYKNAVPWTITLSDVPREATVAHIQRAIISSCDEPRHVEMGEPNYKASDAEVSVEVRSRLERYGPLENFQIACTPKGKRVKATAWFQNEADAMSARYLDDVQLPILGKGKLTVAQVFSVKVKVSKAIYAASKTRIEKEQESWKEGKLKLRIYTDSEQRFALLKVGGADAEAVATVRNKIDRILSGEIITDGGQALWSPGFSINGNASRKLKSIETELDVIIIRNKLKRQLRFHGSPERLQQAVIRIVNLVQQETTSHHKIDLQPHSLAWAVQGGFRKIEQALGVNVAVLDVVSRRITINGTNEQRTLALSIMQNKNASEAQHVMDNTSRPNEACPICFCEAEDAIKTACEHTYCLGCLEEYCKSAASNMKEEFRLKCQGDEGNCSANFTLHELKVDISSSAFDGMLRSSFEEYIQRRPQSFRCCPTPECGFIYRCATTSGPRLIGYRCPGCFEPLCTSCHAQHGEYTCAEYKDIASGGLEALEKLKKELNIKDCPKCSTAMEKVYGCNHMTCGGCKTHICWVCMSVFESAEPCYKHMLKEHDDYTN